MNDKRKVVYTNILHHNGLQWLILFIVVFALYSKTLSFDYNLDDYIITDSLDGKVNSLSDLLSLFKLSYNQADYRPIVFISFGIERLIFGSLNPAVSHGVNACLYFLICISALKLFNILFKQEHRLLLLFGVLLFCVHPINTEAVVSIKCRDNLLSMLFGLTSTIFFIKYFEEKKRAYYLITAIVFSIIALLSKKDALGFWVFSFGYILFLKRDRKVFYAVIVGIVFIIVGSIYSYVVDHTLTKNLSEPLLTQVTFTENPLATNFTFSNRLVAGFNTFYYYFTKLTYTSPAKYYYGYQYYDVLTAKSISFFSGISLFIMLFVSFVYAFIKQNRIVVLCIIGLAGTSIYALNFFLPVAGIIADRYIFIANLFFCLLIVYTLRFVFDYLKIGNYHFHITASVIVVFSIISFIRIDAWKNFRTLIDTDAPKLYNSYEAMRIAASEYYDEYKLTEKPADLEQAIMYAEKANTIYPGNVLVYLLSGKFYFNKGDYNNAIQRFKIAAHNNDTLSEALILIGDIYYASKNSDSALIFYKKALTIAPTNSELINNISTVYYEQGNKEASLKFNYDLIAKDSTTFAAYENLGYYYLAEKDTIKAQYYFKQGERFGLKPIPINQRN